MKTIFLFFKKCIAILVIGIVINYSTPAWAQWTQTQGPTTGLATVVRADYSGHFIAGTVGGGIFVSADSGQTWKQSISGIAEHTFSVNYLDTIGQSLFMIGTSAFIKHLYTSNDHGQTWLVNSISFNNPTGIAHIDSLIFVATNSDGLLYSDDMGASWDTVSTYSFLNTTYPALYGVYVTDSSLFVSVQDSGLFKSSDKGATWVHANGGLSASTPVEKIVSTGSALWASFPYSNELYKSIDGGLNWVLMPPVGNNNSINDLFALNGNLYVITDPHIYVSSNNGISFTNFSGSVSMEYKRLAYNGSTFVSFTNFFGIGIQRSTDNGLSWTESNTGYANSRTMCIYADGNSLFASTYDRDMFITSDSGSTYTRIPGPILNDAFYANDIIKVGNEIIEGGYSKMYKTSNNGATWTNCSPGIPIGCDVKQFLLDGNDLYAATTTGVYRSTSFATWLPLTNGIPAGTEFYSIVKNGTRLFVCGKNANYEAKIYYSDNNGTLWNDISAGFNFGPFSSANKMIISGGTILLSTIPHLYASLDNGLTWNITGAGLPFGLVNCFYLNGSDLYAGMGQWEDPYGDILLSRDNGATWTSIRDNLFNSNVTSIAISNGNMYVGTFWGGVWRRPMSSITVDVPALTHSNETFEIYPNPASEKMLLKNNSGLEAKIIIRNASGQTIYTAASSGNMEVNTSDFKNGIYFVQWTDGNQSTSKKVMISK